MEQADLTVDARGHRCPTPTLRLRRTLEAASTGQRILLLATDPMARIDVPFFLSALPHRLIGTQEADGVLRFLIEKGES